MLQYVLCSPIWINVLNIYAFSNLHDFSWGTKEDGVEEDLGSAAANKDGTVELELPTDQADIGEGSCNTSLFVDALSIHITR